MDRGRIGCLHAESSVTDEDSEERASVSDNSIATVKDITPDGEGDGVVSSLSENKPELCTKDRAQLTPADSVQQEEAVTTSSDSTTVDVQSKHNACIDEGNGTSVVKKGVCNLVSYDSSDSDESSVTTPRIENLLETVFQYPDSNSQTLETKTENNAQESLITNVSSQEQQIEQIDQKVDEKTTSKESAEYEGYWNSDGYWVDSHGQLWQPDDSYWQEQQWSQQSEQGEYHMYGKEDEKGCDTKIQQWQIQGNSKVDHEAQPNNKETTGTDPSYTQPQAQYYTNYYQEHSNQEQYGQQQYYDHSGYCSQETYPNSGNQQQTITDHTGDTSIGSVHSHETYTSTSSIKHVHHESQPQNTHFATSYHHKSSTDQETYTYTHKEDSSQSHTEHMQSYTPNQHDSNYSYNQQSRHHPTYNEQAAVEYNQRYSSHEYTQQDQRLYEHQQQYAHSNSAQHLPHGSQAVASQPSSHNKDWHYGENRDSYNQSFPQYQGSRGDSQCWKATEQQHSSQQVFTNTAMIPSSNPPHVASDIPHNTHPSPPKHPLPLPPNPPPNLPPPPMPPDHPSQSHMYPNPPTHLHSSHPHPYFSPDPHSSPTTHYSPHSNPPLHTPHQSPHSHPRPSSPIHSQSSYYRHYSPQSYGAADRNYSHSSVQKKSFSHTNNSRQRWKHYRRDTSQSRRPHNSPSGATSSPVNSDVSSTSHDSSTSAHLPGSPELEKNKSPSFSQQLRDPRKFSSPVSQSDSNSKTSKNNNSASSLGQNKTSPLRQFDASPITPSGNNPCLSSVHKSSQDTKSKVSTAEPVSFPKSSLSGFKIPKHNKSAESSKTHRNSEVKPITGKVEARILRTNVEKLSSVGSDSKTAKTEQDISVKKSKVVEKGEVGETVEQSTRVKKVEANAVVESKVEEPTSISQSSDTDGISSGDSAKVDLVSLFKTIDSNTLTALASTIQLALDSNVSHQKVKLKVDQKVPPVSSTKPTENDNNDHKKTTFSNASDVKKLTSNDEQQPAVVTKCSSDDVDIVQEAIDSEPKVEQGTDASDNSIKSTKTGVSSAPRMVIATVLATNSQSSSLPASTSQSQSKDALTVCIPITKEEKLHVKKSDGDDLESKQALEEHDTPLEQEKTSKCETSLQKAAVLPSIECTVPSENNSERHDTSTNSKTESDVVKSPTLSLLRAQDLLFDPKYMYKEYNLRKTRRQESSPEQSSPHKKQKVGKSSTSTVTSDKTKVPSQSTPEKTNKGKRGRPPKESSIEPPNAKKVKETNNSDSEKQRDVQKHEVDDRQTKSDFSVSIHQAQPKSLLQQVTLTQLLTMPKTSPKQTEHVPSTPQKLHDKLSKDKIIGKQVTKIHSSASTILRNKSLCNRAQLVCFLCKRKGGVSNLGFIFGPYFYHLETDSGNENNISSRSDEVWLHEDCCVWAPGVCIVGRELQGLKEALSDANKMVCSECKKLGATLFCASRGCKNIYHFPCAVEKGCVLNEDQFQIHCPRHKDTAA